MTNVGHGKTAGVIGYARVSTGDQDLAGQRLRLEAVGAIRVFDDAMSGKRFDRPGLKALMDFVRRGDKLCVVWLDRLGRSLKELLEIAEDLKEKGIALCSLEENLDTSTATGELIFHVFASLAQFERRLIAERTRDGIQAAKAKGRMPGRPALHSDKIEAAFALIRAGHSPTEAAKHVGLGRSTIYRELQLRPDVHDLSG